jgi:hypothetical protein
LNLGDVADELSKGYAYYEKGDRDGTDLLEKIGEHLLNSAKIIITGFPCLDLGATALDIGIDALYGKTCLSQ